MVASAVVVLQVRQRSLVRPAIEPLLPFWDGVGLMLPAAILFFFVGAYAGVVIQPAVSSCILAPPLFKGSPLAAGAGCLSPGE